MKTFILSVVLLVVGACVSTPSRLRSLSVGAVPCSQDQIEIVDGSIGSELTAYTWSAKCENETYICRSGTGEATNCSKQKSAPAPTTSPKK